MENVEMLSQKEVTHDQEVKELFERVTVKIPGTDMYAINLEGFKIAIDQMMNKAFYYGGKNTIETVEDIMDKIYNLQK